MGHRVEPNSPSQKPIDNRIPEDSHSAKTTALWSPSSTVMTVSRALAISPIWLRLRTNFANPDQTMEPAHKTTIYIDYTYICVSRVLREWQRTGDKRRGETKHRDRQGSEATDGPQDNPISDRNT